MADSAALTRLDAPDADGIPVLAYALHGGLTSDDIETLHGDLDRHERARLLIRVDEFEMPNAGAFAHQLSGLGSFFGPIERYAVVGGPDWLRTYAAIGGALAPFPVKHFDDEATARAWISGAATADEREERREAREDAAPAVFLLNSDRPDLVALRVDGHLTESDYKTVVDPAIESAMRENDPIDLLVRIDDLDGFSLGAAKEDAGLAKHMGSFRRMALVGGPDWMATLASGAGALVPIEIETFETEAEAREWLSTA